MQTLFYITVLQIREVSRHAAERCQLFSQSSRAAVARSPPWHAGQLAGVLLQVGPCEVNVTLQMWSQQCKVQQDHDPPRCAVFTFVRSHSNVLTVHMAGT